jgi:hypothetical protein
MNAQSREANYSGSAVRHFHLDFSEKGLSPLPASVLVRRQESPWLISDGRRHAQFK